MKEYYDAISNLPHELRSALANVDADIAANVTEIRLRTARCVVLTLCQGYRYVKQNGFTSKLSEENMLITSAEMIEACVLSLCGYSVYNAQECINNGYIPMGNGHRAGVCGTAFDNAGEIVIKNITSLNIRVARQDILCCDDRLKKVLTTKMQGVLIAGAPSSGKTTVLKGVIQYLSSQGRRVAVVDERRELCFAKPLQHCDFLSAYPKALGMQQAIRSLSPEVIVCDEIGGMEDARAIEGAVNAGASVVMSVHASCEEALYKRPQIRDVLITQAFSSICMLQGAHCPATIERIITDDAFAQIIRACYIERDRLSYRRIQGLSA